MGFVKTNGHKVPVAEGLPSCPALLYVEASGGCKFLQINGTIYDILEIRLPKIT